MAVARAAATAPTSSPSLPTLLAAVPGGLVGAVARSPRRSLRRGGNGCVPGVSPGGEFVAGGGNKDSCFGDSGGPVYLDTPRGPIVVGAVSRGTDNSPTPCGGGGIYVRTDKIVSWLESTTGKQIAKDSCAGSGAGDGTGGGDGGGRDGTGGGDDGADLGGDVTGGCAAGGAAAGGFGGPLAIALAFVGLRRRARREAKAQD